MDETVTVAIAGVRRAHEALFVTVAGLDDDLAARPSRLPGWSVGHVMTHLARNAEGFVRVFDAANRGEVGDQYPGGATQRNADIEAGAPRSAAALRIDVMRACEALEAAWATTTEPVWRDGRGNTGFATGWPVAGLPFARWREVEVHHSDLGLGYSIDDWPDDYVSIDLEGTLDGLPNRLSPDLALVVHATDTGERWLVPPDAARRDALEVSTDRRRLLAWLLGRFDNPAFPSIESWQRDRRP